MLIENETRIYINHNNMLIPRKDYFVLYAYVYNPETNDFVYIAIDEVKTIAEGYKYNKTYHYSQFTKKDFAGGLKG